MERQEKDLLGQELFEWHGDWRAYARLDSSRPIELTEKQCVIQTVRRLLPNEATCQFLFVFFPEENKHEKVSIASMKERKLLQIGVPPESLAHLSRFSKHLCLRFSRHDIEKWTLSSKWRRTYTLHLQDWFRFKVPIHAPYIEAVAYTLTRMPNHEEDVSSMVRFAYVPYIEKLFELKHNLSSHTKSSIGFTGNAKYPTINIIMEKCLRKVHNHELF